MTKRPRLQIDLSDRYKRALLGQAGLLNLSPSELVARWVRENCPDQLLLLERELGPEQDHEEAEPATVPEPKRKPGRPRKRKPGE